MNFLILTGIQIAVVAGAILFLGIAQAEEAAGPHPAFRNEMKQPSRTLFQSDANGMREVHTYGKEVAIAKLNQMMFKRDVQELTAPDAFRAVKPVVPEKPNTSRRPQ